MNWNSFSSPSVCGSSFSQRSFWGLVVGLFLLFSVGASNSTAQIAVVNTISTVAGTGVACSPITTACGDGAAATSATFSNPWGVAVDAVGNIYIADRSTHRIRKIDATTGYISTIAGTGTICSPITAACGDGAAATSANLNNPYGVAVDPAGNVYVADYGDQRIRKISAATGFISTVAGNGTACASPTSACGDGAAATSANIRNPYGVALDRLGNLYIADLSDNRIRKVDASTGFISTVAGSGTACTPTTAACGDGAAAISARLTTPTGIAVDAAGNLYIADIGDHRIRKVDATTGYMSTLAGTGTAGFSGDGTAATSATLSSPSGVAVDDAGNVYIADYGNNRTRMVNAGTGFISTVVGSGSSCLLTTSACGDGGAATSALMNSPYGVAVDHAGIIYVPDRVNNRVRKVQPGTLFAKTSVGASSTQTVLLSLTGSLNITAINVPLSQGNTQEYTTGTATGCTVDSTGATSTASGSTCTVPVTFTPAYAGQRLLPLQVVTTASTYSATLNGIGIGSQVALTPGTISSIAGTGTACADATSACGDGLAAATAALNNPYGAAVDSLGNVYIADYADHRIRKVTAGTGVVSTIAGTGSAGFSGDGAAATSATLNGPRGVAVDGSGNIYFADYSDHRVRKVDASTGYISTIAGTGTACSSATAACGDGALATNANLSNPYGITVDGTGNLYIADYGDHRIRRVDASTGLIWTIAGTGTADATGDGAAATSAGLNAPAGVAIDSSRNIYIADSANNRVRKIDAGTGYISTIAGTGSAGSTGDGAAATSASLNAPISATLDSAGNLYIAEYAGHRIRKIEASTGYINTVAGTGSSGVGSSGVAATSSALNSPASIAIDSAGNLYIADSGNHSIRQVNTASGLLNFSTPTTVDTTDSADGAQTAVLSNIGNQDLTFAVPATGTNPSVSTNFAWSSNSTCPQLSTSSVSTPLSSGASCTLAVDFTPATTGSINGSIVVTDDALHVAGATQSVALTGTAVAAHTGGIATTTIVSLSPNSITFGQSTNLTATVTPASGSTSPSGTVTFTDAVGITILTVGTAPVASGSATFSYTPTAAGSHLITATFTSSDTTEFESSVDSVGRSLTVTQITPTLTVNAVSTGYGISPTTLRASMAYTGTLAPTGAVTFIVDNGASVTATCTGSSSPLTCTATYDTSLLTVSNHTITVAVAATSNYNATSATGTLTITAVAPAVTVSAVTINVGSSPTVLTANVVYTGALAPTGALSFTINGGTPVVAACTGTSSPLTCTASYITSSLVSGNYAINAALAADANYTAASATGTLTATVQDFTFTSTSPASQTITGGDSVSLTYALSPIGSLYPDVVSFTVGGLPASATYTFTPTTVASAGGAQTITLAVTTVASASVRNNHILPWSRGSSLVFAGLLLPFCFLRRRVAITGRRLILFVLMLGGTAALVTGITGCGNSEQKKPSTSYTVVVTAASGSVQRRAAVTLNVQ